MNHVPLSKYDYGYIKDGGPDWYGSAMGGGGYYGPPHSMWWNVLAFIAPWAVRAAFGCLVIALLFLKGN